MLVQYLWLITFGFAGGYLGKCTKIPGGSLLGAMIFTAIGNSFILQVQILPEVYTFSLQILVGALVGQEITMKAAKEAKKIILPILISSGFLVITALVLMVFLNRFFNWDLTTAWLGTAPGRMTDMVIIADIVEANGTKVFAAHLMRHLFVIFLTPLILYLAKKIQKPEKDFPS